MTTHAETKERIQALLATNDRAVERALVAIFRRQTSYEQQAEATNEDNNVGFTGADAGFLSSLAKGVLRFGHLTPKQLPYARKKMMKYHRQLAEIAAENGREVPVPEPVEEPAEHEVTELKNDAWADRMEEKASVQEAEATEEARVAEFKYRRESRGY